MHYKLPDDPFKPLLINGDAFEEIRMIESNSICSVIIDFPYLIEFMGLSWDKLSDDKNKQYESFFRECIRILKPGGRMIAFTGTVNYDLFVGWGRKAGFKIEPMMIWAYSSGMPHGIDVVKYLIKQDHIEFAVSWDVTDFRLGSEYKYEIDIKHPITERTEKLSGVVPEMFRKFASYKRSSKTSKDLLLSKLRYLHAEYFGYSVISYDFIESDNKMIYRTVFRNRSKHEVIKTGEATDIMIKYDGFNSGLKPAIEPIAHLMKPIDTESIVANIVKWGVGALNINDCKIPLAGMENADIEQIITDMKIKIGLLPESCSTSSEPVDTRTIIDNVKSISQTRNGEDHTFGNTSIRDRMNSGGSSNIEKAISDIESQMFGSDKATDGSVFKNTSISDRMNSGGGGKNESMKKTISDLKSQMVGYDAKKNKDSWNIYDNRNKAGNIASDNTKETVKFLKGSHEMYGSSGSGVYNYNNGDKSLKVDVDKAVGTIQRKVNRKGSGSGIMNFNKSSDPTEEEMRKINNYMKDISRMRTIKTSNSFDSEYQERHGSEDGYSDNYEMIDKFAKDLKNQTTRHDPTKHKGAFWGGGDIPMNGNIGMMPFFDKMRGRYPSNLITLEHGVFDNAVLPPKILGSNYDKIFMIPKPTTSEKFKGIPKSMYDMMHKTVKPIKLMEHLVKLVNPRPDKDVVIADFMMGCYDDQTEILTEDGFVMFKNLETTQKVASLVNGKLVYVQPKTYYKYDYEGEMCRIKSKTVDLFVTPNHNMYYRNHQRYEYSLDSIEKIMKNDWNIFQINNVSDWEGIKVDHFILPSVKNLKNNPCVDYSEKKIPMNDWLEFFGYFIADGSVSCTKGKLSGRVYLHCTRLRKINKFRSVLDRMPFKYIRRTTRFEINDKQLYIYLKQFGKSKDKFIPKWMKNLDNHSLNILFDALISSDGSVQKSKEKVKYTVKDKKIYYTVSKTLADDVSEIIIKTGYNPVIRKRSHRKSIIKGRSIKSNNIQYEVYQRLSKCSTVKKDKNISKEHYKGKVYCVEVPSHVILVRRNKNCIWCGNSGSTIVAAKSLGYCAIGVEIDKSYYDLAAIRIKNISKIQRGII